VYIRLKMEESPLFAKLKSEGKTSVNPLKESFSHKANFKMVLLALFGAVMGQGVIWYTGQFYAQSFLETKCNIEFEQSRTILLWAIVFATPFFLFFGWLSDKIGRKWIMMTGLALGILTYRPIFSYFLEQTSITKWEAESPIYTGSATNKQDSVKGTDKKLDITNFTMSFPDGRRVTEVKVDTVLNGPNGMRKVSGPVTYINKHLPPGIYWKFIGLVFCLILYVTMVYGPIAAFLVEMFPTRIRYTSMSLHYHIGNGVFGGLVPFIGLLLTTTYPKDPLVGLWYPIGVAALCLIIGCVYLTNKIDKDITD
jgi:MFS family permease